MLYTKSQLRAYTDPLDVLNKAVYLNEEESRIIPQMVPVLEVSRLSAYCLPFYAVQALAEANAISLFDAIGAVCNEEGIHPQDVVISMTEDQVILNPKVVQELGNVVVVPISKEDPDYKWCKAIIDECYYYLDGRLLESFGGMSEDGDVFGNMYHQQQQIQNQMIHDSIHATNQADLDRIQADTQREFDRISQETIDEFNRRQRQRNAEREERRRKQQMSSTSNSSSHRSTTSSNSSSERHDTKRTKIIIDDDDTTSAVDGKLKRIKAEAEDEPKSLLAKKIAALRHIYQDYLHKAQKERSQNKAGIFKTIAAKILGVIDFLLKKLQHAVN